jgi:hypothetical protein
VKVLRMGDLRWGFFILIYPEPFDILRINLVEVDLATPNGGVEWG